jgi:gas vesicle protein
LIELAIGVVIGTLASLVIAEAYHRRASAETKREVDRLRELAEELSKTVAEIKHSSFYAAEMTEVVKRHVTANTPDDPEYPYK